MPPIIPIDSFEQTSITIRGVDIEYALLSIFEGIMIVLTLANTASLIERLVHICFRLCTSSCLSVAVQLPMMNEIECCKSVIECTCNLDWPRNRLFIQVLDDFTEEHVKMIIDKYVQSWVERGVQIAIYRRTHREGFKAGNLLHDMSFISDAEYIAIFDVDYLPTKDYLIRAMPAPTNDPTVAFVQARWVFTNSKDSLLTRAQEIILNFHHKCEQEGKYRASLFFTFNGAGGIWRATAIKQVGGWHTDNLVEDLDLSMRAHLNGWRSVYMIDVQCLNELPPTVFSYLSQQHRWTSGHTEIARKMISKVC